MIVAMSVQTIYSFVDAIWVSGLGPDALSAVGFTFPIFFLAMALAWSEVLGAHDIFIGVNAVDYSGYPDCRPEFIESFERMANLATRAGIEDAARLRIRAPLMSLSKAEIIQRGEALGVDYGLSVSCYQADAQGRACGTCDSCRLRREGFAEAGVPDPTAYR
jgi:7-cyano-7-deazaguanine synthase